MTSQATELLQGTLDLLILKAISLGPLHGYGVLLQASANLQRHAAGSARLAVPRACTASSIRGSSRSSGASPTTSGKPSSTR